MDGASLFGNVTPNMSWMVVPLFAGSLDLSPLMIGVTLNQLVWFVVPVLLGGIIEITDPATGFYVAGGTDRRVNCAVLRIRRAERAVFGAGMIDDCDLRGCVRRKFFRAGDRQ